MPKSPRLTTLVTFFALSIVLAVAAACMPIQAPTEGMQDTTAASTLDLRLIETTDIHVYLMNFDYYRDQQDDTVGLAKAATLIEDARQEVSNALLVDNGDLIQGNPMGDFVVERGLAEGEVHPVYKAMNLLPYEVGNIGNHEFNYGLEFLSAALSGAEFPYINANIVDASTGEPYFQPYIIKDYELTASDGSQQTLSVGFIGFVPPQVMQWDKRYLEGSVTAMDIVEAAEKYVPEMEDAGADVIIAIAHSGLNVAAPEGGDENASYYLADVPGIDAILFGHAHRVFPGPDFEDLPEVDNAKGTLKGVPAVMPGYWGNHVGIVDLKLQQVDGEWQVVDSQSEARPIFERVDGNVVSLAETYEPIVDAVAEEHEATRAWLNEPFAESEAPMVSYFALVQDDPSIQIVTDAQKWYTERIVQGTELDGLPILSAGAPFKAGRGGPNDYTDVPAGPIAFKNVADLYLYPNTVKVLKLTGKDVREWLEMSAGQFNQIDPASTEVQQLINTDFPTYNFDVLDGVTYQIDVTQPARYDKDGNLVNEDAHRIVELAYEGTPVEDDQEFLVVSNNYRASGGGNFPGITSDKIVVDAPDANRDVLASYMIELRTINPTPDGNWRISPINDTVNVVFRTSPSSEAAVYAEGLPAIAPADTTDDEGFAIYSLDLSQ
ncbi:MAG: bifunctional 2',3'-cyclic-nucleotide 2'-phosphodiesterase/3'-nucleotidase [Caldilineaceae bacterium]